MSDTQSAADEESATGAQRKMTDGGKTPNMSESTTDDAAEQNEYRIEVWATSEFQAHVRDAETEDEAEEEAEEIVRNEHFGAEIQTVRVREADGENEWWGAVWAQQQYIETIMAASEDEAKEEMKDILYATTNVVTKDIDSIRAREVA